MVGGRQEIGAVTDLDLDGVPARLYVPSERLGQERVPTLLYLHGGGWIYGGGFGTHEAACRFLAEHSGVQLLAEQRVELARELADPSEPRTAGD